MTMLRGLAVSNIAWPQARLPEAIALASRLGFDGIEIAPYNVFGRWDVPDGEVEDLRGRIEDAGLSCPALQGILFNAPDVALFEGPESRLRLRAQLETVARIAGLLGASACVFGAPRQRDPKELEPDQAWGIAVDFFRDASRAFADHGTTLAFEANARVYGCRFVTTTAEAVEFVRAVASPGFGLQIDMGTIFLEEEDPSVLEAAAPLAAHAHVSEPQLQPLGTAGVDHRPTAAALRESGYRGFLSAEMRPSEVWEDGVAAAAKLLREVYS